MEIAQWHSRCGTPYVDLEINEKSGKLGLDKCWKTELRGFSSLLCFGCVKAQFFVFCDNWLCISLWAYICQVWQISPLYKVTENNCTPGTLSNKNPDLSKPTFDKCHNGKYSLDCLPFSFKNENTCCGRLDDCVTTFWLEGNRQGLMKNSRFSNSAFYSWPKNQTDMIWITDFSFKTKGTTGHSLTWEW